MHLLIHPTDVLWDPYSDVTRLPDPKPHVNSLGPQYVQMTSLDVSLAATIEIIKKLITNKKITVHSSFSGITL